MSGEERIEAAVVGLGYVGITLATVIAGMGIRVHGVEKNPRVVDTLLSGKSHIYEPGSEEILAETIGRNFSVSDSLPEGFDGIVVVAVSTPAGTDGRPDLANLEDAVRKIAAAITDDALVVIRSTVPIGTTRKLVLRILRDAGSRAGVAFCPERTIQGRALSELRTLPQVVSGENDASREKAAAFFAKITGKIVPVSSLEAAEAVKLINNCHTDLIYSYGNQVALIADSFGLDAMELIDAANRDYPRPDLAAPGYVTGPCLTKDPYLLLASIEGGELVRAARRLNEYMMDYTVEKVLDRLGKVRGERPAKPRIFLLGLAYKGVPETDDIRGSAAPRINRLFIEAGAEVSGWDPFAPRRLAEESGIRWAEPSDGFSGADAAVFLNDHPSLASLPIGELGRRMRTPCVVFDAWRIIDPAGLPEGAAYIGLGLG